MYTEKKNFFIQIYVIYMIYIHIGCTNSIFKASVKYTLKYELY